MVRALFGGERKRPAIAVRSDLAVQPAE